MHNKKKIWIAMIALVVIVIAIALGVVEWRHNRVAKTSMFPVALENSSTTAVAASPTSSAPPTSGPSSPVSAVTSSVTNPGVSISIQRFYAGSSFSFSYPSSWSIFNTAPFSITNFNGRYISRDVIPVGGAEIDVVTTTNYGNLQDIMTTELMGATNLTTSTVTVSGVTCIETHSDRSFSDGTPSGNIAVYCERGTALWKIYLSYRKSDPAAAARIADFTGVLSSLQFLPKD
jgi:hypothetical protein